MFCVNCGKPTEGDQLLCADCAAQQDAAAQEETTALPQEEAAVQPAQEVPVQDTFELDTPAPEKPKKMVGLIAGIAALVVAVAAVIGIALNVDSVKAFWGRTFTQPDAYLEQVAGDAFAAYADELTQIYGQVLDSTPTSQNAANAEMHLLLGDNLLYTLEIALEQQGMALDLDWLSDIMLTVDANVQDDSMQMDMGIGLGDQEALSVDMIFDLAELVIYLGVPDLNETYLSMDMSGDMSSQEMMEAMTQSREAADELMKALPSEDAMNKMLNSYVKLVLAEINDVQKETGTIEVSGISQKVVTLTAKITEEDFYTIVEKVVKHAETDATLKQVLDAFSAYTNTVNQAQGSEYAVDLYGDFSQSIQDALEELEYIKADAEQGNYLLLKTYVDMMGSLRGFELIPYTNDEQEDAALNCLTAEKDGTTYIVADLDGLELTGESTEEKGASTGFCKVVVEDEEMFTLEYENVTQTAGTLRVIPSEEMVDSILAETGLPSAMLGDKLALELTYNTEETKESVELWVLTDGETLIGLTITSETYEGGEITIPADTIDANSSDEVNQWIRNMDFDGVLTKLEDAGVDPQIIDLLRTYASYLAG